MENEEKTTFGNQLKCNSIKKNLLKPVSRAVVFATAKKVEHVCSFKMSFVLSSSNVIWHADIRRQLTVEESGLKTSL